MQSATTAPADRPDRDAQTDGHLLGGRVAYAQPRYGFRSGIEPVLLAASIPAQAGQRVLEGGTGAGATLLCLAARVANLQGMGVEQDTLLVELARRNAAANGWSGLGFLAADMAALPELGGFDHACANPPYHAATGTESPDAARKMAKGGKVELFGVWAAALAKPLRPRGTLTFILPSAMLPVGIEAFRRAGCSPTAVLPLWPKAGRPAKLVLLRGVKGSRAPFSLLPGLELHDAAGGFTDAAEAILRHGQRLLL